MHKEKNVNDLIRATTIVAMVISPKINTNCSRTKPCSAHKMLSIVASPVNLSSALLLKVNDSLIELKKQTSTIT